MCASCTQPTGLQFVAILLKYEVSMYFSPMTNVVGYGFPAIAHIITLGCGPYNISTSFE